MDKLKELYESLFLEELEPETYSEKLLEIEQAIKEQTEEYFPQKLNLFGDEFKPLGYVCVTSYKVYSHEEGDFQQMAVPLGTVLLRQLHWDRDHYYNIYPHKEYVAGGPLEKDTWKVCWLPLYKKEHIVTSFSRLQALHKKDFFDTWEKDFEPR